MTTRTPSRQGVAHGLQVASAPTRTSGLAIASIVLSLLGCFLVTAIAGVICGHLARKRIRNNPSISGDGLALAGLIIGYIMILFCAGGAMKFGLDVRNKVREVQAQRTGQSVPNSAQGSPGHARPAGQKIRSSISLPADPISGTIKGEPFNYSRSTLFQGGGGMLQIDGREFAKEGFFFTIFLRQKPGESLEGRTWHITPTTAPGATPSIIIVKMGPGAPVKDRIDSGYEMDLTIGEASGGIQTQIGGIAKRPGARVAGTIKLKSKGSVPVDLHGNFTAMFD